MRLLSVSGPNTSKSPLSQGKSNLMFGRMLLKETAYTHDGTTHIYTDVSVRGYAPYVQAQAPDMWVNEKPGTVAKDDSSKPVILTSNNSGVEKLTGQLDVLDVPSLPDLKIKLTAALNKDTFEKPVRERAIDAIARSMDPELVIETMNPRTQVKERWLFQFQGDSTGNGGEWKSQKVAIVPPKGKGQSRAYYRKNVTLPGLKKMMPLYHQSLYGVELTF